MDYKERFISVYREKIKREGADTLLDYLCSDKSDFFTAPASTRYHNSFPGGLVSHSLNVYDCLCDYLSRRSVKDEYGCAPCEESAAIAALLHDICKVNFYKESTRNVKDERGVWKSVPYYEIDDAIPYGHGEKSVYVISGFFKLTREEAFAIRYHMGFSGNTDPRDTSAAFTMFPLAFALSVADMEATFFKEKES